MKLSLTLALPLSTWSWQPSSPTASSWPWSSTYQPATRRPCLNAWWVSQPAGFSCFYKTLTSWCLWHPLVLRFTVKQQLHVLKRPFWLVSTSGAFESWTGRLKGYGEAVLLLTRKWLVWLHKGPKQTSSLPPPPSGCNTTRWLLIRARHQLLNEKLCQQACWKWSCWERGPQSRRVLLRPIYCFICNGC